MTENEMKALIEKAEKAGMAAGFSAAPLSDRDADKENRGGFAWVLIHAKEGDSEQEDFLEYLLGKGIAEHDYIYGGIQVRITDFENSYIRRIAFSKAFAVVMVQAGFTALALNREK